MKSLSRGEAALQGGVGLVDDFQALLRNLVATVSIRVVELHQLLVARLELLEGDRPRELERRKGLRLGGRPRALRALPLGLALLLEEVEEVAQPGLIEAPGAERTDAERPSGALPHRVAPEMELDLALVHACEIVPAPVIVAHMREAEPIIVGQALAVLGRAVEALLGAFRGIAAAQTRRRFRSPWIHADVGLSVHRLSMGRPGASSKPALRRAGCGEPNCRAAPE